MTTALRARRTTPFALGLLALVFLFAGCDSDSLGGHGPEGPPGPPGPPGQDGNVNIRVIEFGLNDRDNRDDFIFSRTLSDSGLEVQYEGTFSALTASAVDDGLVLLYASDQTGSGGIDGLIRDGWTALPVTLGIDLDDDFFIDYTLTTTYTYDIGRLYVNLVASNDFSDEVFAISDAVLENIESIAFKLVILPGGGFARGIDYSDYEAVKRAYNLPD